MPMRPVIEPYVDYAADYFGSEPPEDDGEDFEDDGNPYEGFGVMEDWQY